MILSYLKTKTLLKNCHIILYWTQESSFPSQVWSPGRGAPQFILSANVRYPIHSLEYTPGLWQVIAFLLRGLDAIDPGVEVGLGPIPLLSSHLPLRWRKVTHKGCWSNFSMAKELMFIVGWWFLSNFSRAKNCVSLCFFDPTFFQGKGLCVWPSGSSNTGDPTLEAVIIGTVDAKCKRFCESSMGIDLGTILFRPFSTLK